VPVLVIQHLHSHALATLGSRATGFREEPLESADSRFGTPIPKMTFVLHRIRPDAAILWSPFSVVI